MRLGAQQFSDIMASLQPPASGGSGQEKRAVRRLPVMGRVPVITLSQGGDRRAYTALTRDLSLTGISLLQSIPVAKDDLLVVRLPCGKRAKPILLVCQVRHCRSLAQGLFAVGAEFKHELDQDFQASPADERQRQIERIRQSILG